MKEYKRIIGLTAGAGVLGIVLAIMWHYLPALQALGVPVRGSIGVVIALIFSALFGYKAMTWKSAAGGGMIIGGGCTLLGALTGTALGHSAINILIPVTLIGLISGLAGAVAAQFIGNRKNKRAGIATPCSGM